MRVESQQPAKGDGGGWIHRRDGQPIRLLLPTQTPPLEHNWMEMAKKCFGAPEASAMRAELASELGVSVESLERLLVGAGWDDFRRIRYSTWPERRSGGKVLGIMRRYNIPVAENGGCKLTMKGSAHGLYIPRDWWRGYGPVLVVEGGSDTAAALTLGLSAIGRPSNIGGVNLLIGLLGSCERPIIVLGERDRKPDRVGTRKQCHANCDGCSWCYPGRYGARVTAERLRAATGFKRIIWRMPPAGVKDLRAWVQSEHEPTAAKLLNRLEMV